MYLSDPSRKLPPDSAKVWRYIGLAKFLSMLDTSSLWFARIGTFEDAYEGTLSIPAFEAFQAKSGEERQLDPQSSSDLSRAIFSALSHSSRLGSFVNCWHLNEGESAALWKIYSGESLAIRSDVGRLKRCFRAERVRQIQLGQVRYVEDPEMEITDEGNMTKALLTKRSIFDYERELRAFTFDYPPIETPDDFDGLVLPAGLPVAVDLDILIERVYVSPNQTGWFKSLIESTLAKYGYRKKPVEWSQMGRKPEYWRDPRALTTPRR